MLGQVVNNPNVRSNCSQSAAYFVPMKGVRSTSLLLALALLAPGLASALPCAPSGCEPASMPVGHECCPPAVTELATPCCEQAAAAPATPARAAERLELASPTASSTAAAPATVVLTAASPPTVALASQPLDRLAQGCVLRI